MQRRVTLEGELLNLGRADVLLTELEENAEVGVSVEFRLVFRRAEIQIEKRAGLHFAITAADARGRTDGENKRDDEADQQGEENEPEVALEGNLNPRNHGRKRVTLGRVGGESIGDSRGMPSCDQEDVTAGRGRW